MPSSDTINSHISNTQSTHGSAAQASAAKTLILLRQTYSGGRVIAPTGSDQKIIEATAGDMIPINPGPSAGIGGILQFLIYTLNSSEFSEDNWEKVVTHVGKVVNIGTDHWTTNQYYSTDTEQMHTVDSPLGETLNLVCLALFDDQAYQRQPDSNADREQHYRISSLFNCLLAQPDNICSGGMQHEYLFLLNRIYCPRGSNEPLHLIEDLDSFIVDSMKSQLAETILREYQDPTALYQFIRPWALPLNSDADEPEYETWLIEQKEELKSSLLTICQDRGFEPRMLDTKITQHLSNIEYLEAPTSIHPAILLLQQINTLLLTAGSGAADHLTQRKMLALTSIKARFAENAYCDLDTVLVSLQNFTRALDVCNDLRKSLNYVLFIGDEMGALKDARDQVVCLLIDYFEAFAQDSTIHHLPENFKACVQAYYHAEQHYRTHSQFHFIKDFFAILTETGMMQMPAPEILSNFAVTDEMLREWLAKYSTEDGAIELSPYEINLILINACYQAPMSWSDSFIGALKLVVDWLLQTENTNAIADLVRLNYRKSMLGNLRFCLKIRVSENITLAEKRCLFEEIGLGEEAPSEERGKSIYQKYLIVESISATAFKVVWNELHDDVALIITDFETLYELLTHNELAEEHKNHVWHGVQNNLSDKIVDVEQLVKLLKCETFSAADRNFVFNALKNRFTELVQGGGHLQKLLLCKKLTRQQRMSLLESFQGRLVDMIKDASEFHVFMNNTNLYDYEKTYIIRTNKDSLSKLVNDFNDLKIILTVSGDVIVKEVEIIQALTSAMIRLASIPQGYRRIKLLADDYRHSTTVYKWFYEKVLNEDVLNEHFRIKICSGTELIKHAMFSSDDTVARIWENNKATYVASKYKIRRLLSQLWDDPHAEKVEVARIVLTSLIETHKSELMKAKPLIMIRRFVSESIFQELWQDGIKNNTLIDNIGDCHNFLSIGHLKKQEFDYLYEKIFSEYSNDIKAFTLNYLINTRFAIPAQINNIIAFAKQNVIRLIKNSYDFLRLIYINDTMLNEVVWNAVKDDFRSIFSSNHELNFLVSSEIVTLDQTNRILDNLGNHLLDYFTSMKSLSEFIKKSKDKGIDISAIITSNADKLTKIINNYDDLILLMTLYEYTEEQRETIWSSLDLARISPALKMDTNFKLLRVLEHDEIVELYRAIKSSSSVLFGIENIALWLRYEWKDPNLRLDIFTTAKDALKKEYEAIVSGDERLWHDFLNFIKNLDKRPSTLGMDIYYRKPWREHEFKFMADLIIFNMPSPINADAILDLMHLNDICEVHLSVLCDKFIECIDSFHYHQLKNIFSFFNRHNIDDKIKEKVLAIFLNNTSANFYKPHSLLADYCSFVDDIPQAMKQRIASAIILFLNTSLGMDIPYSDHLISNRDSLIAGNLHEHLFAVYQILNTVYFIRHTKDKIHDDVHFIIVYAYRVVRRASALLNDTIHQQSDPLTKNAFCYQSEQNNQKVWVTNNPMMLIEELERMLTFDKIYDLSSDELKQKLSSLSSVSRFYAHYLPNMASKPFVVCIYPELKRIDDGDAIHRNMTILTELNSNTITEKSILDIKAALSPVKRIPSIEEIDIMGNILFHNNLSSQYRMTLLAAYLPLYRKADAGYQRFITQLEESQLSGEERTQFIDSLTELLGNGYGDFSLFQWLLEIQQSDDEKEKFLEIMKDSLQNIIMSLDELKILLSLNYLSDTHRLFILDVLENTFPDNITRDEKHMICKVNGESVASVATDQPAAKAILPVTNVGFFQASAQDAALRNITIAESNNSECSQRM